jgi:mannose PTS system EIIA component
LLAVCGLMGTRVAWAVRRETASNQQPVTSNQLTAQRGIIRNLMIGALIVTHGNLAFELLNAARQIEADVTGIEAVPLDWSDTVEEARAKIAAALERTGRSESVIIFTDMFGGTPSNISLSFLEPGRIEIVTGVNLPMIVKFATVKEESNDVSGLAHVISEKGSKAIRVASDLLSAEKRAGVPV